VLGQIEAAVSGDPSTIVDWNNNYGDDPDKAVATENRAVSKKIPGTPAWLFPPALGSLRVARDTSRARAERSGLRADLGLAHEDCQLRLPLQAVRWCPNRQDQFVSASPKPVQSSVVWYLLETVFLVPACIGLKTHSGWAALVAIGKDRGQTFQLIERRHVELVD
jgi:hypothetical protein